MNTHWTEVQDHIVIANWGKISASEISIQLGSAKSRNAVIGRAKRLGLKRLAPTNPRLRNKQLNGRPKKPQQPSLKSYKAPELEEPAPEPPIPEPEIPRVGKVRLIDAGRCQCRWMVDDEHVCAKPTQNGSSWCTEHHARVFKSVEVRRHRNAA